MSEFVKVSFDEIEFVEGVNAFGNTREGRLTALELHHTPSGKALRIELDEQNNQLALSVMEEVPEAPDAGESAPAAEEPEVSETLSEPSSDVPPASDTADAGEGLDPSSAPPSEGSPESTETGTETSGEQTEGGVGSVVDEEPEAQ